MKKIFSLFCLSLAFVSLSATTHEMASVADFNALSAASTDSVHFTCPLIVLGQQGKYMLATDGTNNALLYGTADSCQNGDTLTNVTGLYCMYNDQLELKNSHFTKLGHGPSIAPVEVDHAAADNSLVYGKLTGATASVSNKKITFYTAGGATVAGYNSCGITLPDNPSSQLNYIGFVMNSSNGYQFIPFSWSGTVVDIVYTPVASVAEYLALADGSYFEFTSPVTVSFVYRIRYNCATFFQDAAGDGAQIYEVRHDTNTPYQVAYEMGDVIPAGWKGIKIDYSGTKEITPVEGFGASEGTPADIKVTERTFATLSEADVNNVVLVKNVTLTESTYVTSDKDKEKHRNATDGTVDVFDFYDTFHSNEANTGYVLFPETDGTYDVLGIGANYNGKYEVHPISFDGNIFDSLEGVEAAETALKTLENGQLVIYLNGVRYSALGARID